MGIDQAVCWPLPHSGWPRLRRWSPPLRIPLRFLLAQLAGLRVSRVESVGRSSGDISPPLGAYPSAAEPPRPVPNLTEHRFESTRGVRKHLWSRISIPYLRSRQSSSDGHSSPIRWIRSRIAHDLWHSRARRSQPGPQLESVALQDVEHVAQTKMKLDARIIIGPLEPVDSPLWALKGLGDFSRVGDAEHADRGVTHEDELTIRSQ